MTWVWERFLFLLIAAWVGLVIAGVFPLGSAKSWLIGSGVMLVRWLASTD